MEFIIIGINLVIGFIAILANISDKVDKKRQIFVSVSAGILILIISLLGATVFCIEPLDYYDSPFRWA